MRALNREKTEVHPQSVRGVTFLMQIRQEQAVGQDKDNRTMSREKLPQIMRVVQRKNTRITTGRFEKNDIKSSEIQKNDELHVLRIMYVMRRIYTSI